MFTFQLGIKTWPNFNQRIGQLPIYVLNKVILQRLKSITGVSSKQ
jgi:hypothetical protein